MTSDEMYLSGKPVPRIDSFEIVEVDGPELTDEEYEWPVVALQSRANSFEVVAPATVSPRAEASSENVRGERVSMWANQFAHIDESVTRGTHMQFKTIRETHVGEFYKSFSGRRAFYGRFLFRFGLDAKIERILLCNAATPNTIDCATVEQHLPDIAYGVYSVAEREGPLCCVRAEVTDVRLYPAMHVDCMALCGFSFAREILLRAQPIAKMFPEWLTSDVIALAQSIRAAAATDRYLILSDALRDAGCEDQLIHDHLQTCPDHGSSCWVVEMILDQT